MRKKTHHHQKKRRRISFGWVFFIAVCAAVGLDWWLLIGRLAPQKQPQFDVVFTGPTPTPSTPTPDLNTTPGSTPTPSPTPAPLPNSALIDVPFQVQAPNANWDALHEEACEEASLLMVYHYLNRTPIGDANTADTEIKSIINYETQNGYGVSITVEQLASVAQGYYNLGSAHISHDVTIDSIKHEIAQGHPVIIPAAGRLLPNPNFSGSGPLYHMLVIKGYDKDGFITNDPGTRNGDGFRYTYDSLINAIHNWNQQDILQGEKAYLVFD